MSFQRHVDAALERCLTRISAAHARRLRDGVDAALREVAALEWEMQAMREDDAHPDFDRCWIPMRRSCVESAIALARALRMLDHV